IERGFEVNGISTDVVNVFRNLKAGNETVVLDSYSTMSMSIMNNYPVEVSLVPTNLENWDQRLKLSLPAHSERSEIILKLEDFEGIDRLPTLDIQTVVFSYLNMSGTPENFQFTAGNIAFGNQIVLSTDVLSNQLMGLKLYPNPVRNRLYLKVKDTGGLFKITNMNGQNMLTKTIDTMDLENGIPISLKNGLYIVVYEGRDGNHQQLLQVE
ncbi:MAG: T9SS type A sorting domain-containing protein, partial [Bacteroidota bacterium]